MTIKVNTIEDIISFLKDMSRIGYLDYKIHIGFNGIEIEIKQA